MALRHPVDLDGQIFQLAPQIGVTLSGTDGARAIELIERALTTLDSGRRQGSHRAVTFYSDTLRLASLTRLDWQQELTQALQKDELELHYQPRCCSPRARSSRSKHFCAGLTRSAGWCRRRSSCRSPSYRACRCSSAVGCCDAPAAISRRSPNAATRKCGVSVNVGRQYLSAESLAEDVANSATEAGIEPSQLDLEITEQMLSTGRNGLAALHKLRGDGVRVLIDDFGTGYVSLGKTAHLAARRHHDRPLVRRRGRPRSRGARRVPRGDRTRPSHSVCASLPKASRPKRRHSSSSPNSATRARATSSVRRRHLRNLLDRYPARRQGSASFCSTHGPALAIVDIAHGFNRPLSEVRHTLPESGVTHARCEIAVSASNGAVREERTGANKRRE